MCSDKKRVVVTGLGIVSPVGNDVSAAWKYLCEGRSGVAAITSFDTSLFSTKIAAQVRDFNPLLSLTDKEVRRTDLFVQYAVEAARQAMLDSGLSVTEELSSRVGVAIGSGIGGL